MILAISAAARSPRASSAEMGDRPREGRRGRRVGGIGRSKRHCDLPVALSGASRGFLNRVTKACPE